MSSSATTAQATPATPSGPSMDWLPQEVEIDILMVEFISAQAQYGECMPFTTTDVSGPFYEVFKI